MKKPRFLDALSVENGILNLCIGHTFIQDMLVGNFRTSRTSIYNSTSQLTDPNGISAGYEQVTDFFRDLLVHAKTARALEHGGVGPSYFLNFEP